MENVSVTVPKSTFCWVVTHVPANARRVNDYVFDDPAAIPGTVEEWKPGTCLLTQTNSQSARQIETNVLILLPTADWHNARTCMGKDWTYLLRDYIRSWLLLSPECRVMRAINETIVDLQDSLVELEQQIFPEPITDDPRVERLHAEILTWERTFADISLGSATNTTPERITAAFHRWVETISASTGLEPSEISVMLTRGIQNKSAPVNVDSVYTREFSRALRFNE
jgi:hypothetical protein